MKITIDISQSIYGTGVADYTFGLVKSLRDLYPLNDYKLFAGSLRRQQEFHALWDKALVYPLPPALLHFLWNKIHVLNIEYLVGNTDVYHSSDWAQAPSKAKKVSTIHDLSPLLFPQEMKGSTLRNIAAVHSARLKRVKEECDKIICVSNSTAKDAEELLNIEKSRINVVYEAMPLRFAYRPSKQDTTVMKKKFAVEDYILANGTISPRKNIKRLIESFLTYRKKLSLPEKLIIVGRFGWGELNIPSDNSIILTGYLKDHEFLSLMAGAKVFAYPSVYEGFGLPILTAFYQRTPVLTSNVSSMPEIAGKAAVLVDPTSEAEIAHGLAKAIADSDSLVKAGSFQLSKFSWEKTARETFEVYKS